MALNIQKPFPPKKTISYQKFKRINKTTFKHDLENALSKFPKECNLEQGVNYYNKALNDMMENHAPTKTKTLRLTHHQPWFNEQIKMEIILRRKKERTWINSSLKYDYIPFYNQWRHVVNIIKTAQKDYFKEKFLECKTAYKRICRLTNKMLFRNEPLLLPLTTDTKALAEGFKECFHNKIKTIMNTFKSKSNSITSNNIETDFFTTERMDILTTPDMEHIIKTIISMTMKWYKLDPIPTSLLKKHLPTVIDSIQSITKLSFQTGQVSTNLKEAILQPLLKKFNLALTFKNYRPVSNLTFLSKVIEKIAAQQTVEHITKTGNLEAYQSAYRDNHST